MVRPTGFEPVAYGSGERTNINELLDSKWVVPPVIQVARHYLRGSIPPRAAKPTSCILGRLNRMKLLAMVALASVLATGSASAQAIEGSSLRTAARAYAATLIADDVTTAWCQHKGCTENNPIARPFVTGNLLARTVGLAIDVAIAYGVAHVVSKHHPTAAARILWVGTAIRAAATTGNVISVHLQQPLN